MTIIEGIRDYMAECPFLRDGLLNVEYLGQTPTEYVIESVPTDPIVRKYADGGALKRYLFLFASREYFGNDVLRNLDNSGFYEKMADWIREQNNLRHFPCMDKGRVPQEIKVVSTGYLFDAAEKNARYQIQLQLLYYEA